MPYRVVEQVITYVYGPRMTKRQAEKKLNALRREERSAWLDEVPAVRKPKKKISNK